MKKRMAQRTALGLAISMVMTYPVALQALGLGELHSSSQLNEPLNAQIDLLSTSAAEARQLQVRLASPDVFSRVGIDRPDFLKTLSFAPSVKNGKPIIRVTSRTPISEPFLNFLLEVSWPQGQLLKEYTVLLDPPVLMNAGNASTENAVAVRAEPQSSGRVVRNQEAERLRAQKQRAEQQRKRQLEVQRQKQEQQRRQQQQGAKKTADMQKFEAEARAVMNDKKSAPARSAGSSKYRVKRGDTMGRIASRLRYRGVSKNQMMLALFRANPHAFSQNNINNLKAGSVLSRPSKNEVFGRSSNDSKKIVRQHFSQWKKYRSGLATKTVPQQPSSSRATPKTVSPSALTRPNSKANLRVAGSEKDSKPSNIASAIGSAVIHKQLTLAQEALASSKSETAELRSRVGKLEAIIRKKDRLITLKNDRLATLEVQYSGALNANADLNVDQSKDIATEVGNQHEQSSGRVIRGENSGAVKDNPADSVRNPEQQANSVSSTSDNKELNRDRSTPERVVARDNTDSTNDQGEGETPSPFVGDESKAKSGLLELLSSPLVAAIGGGGLLALLLGWFLMRRSALKPEDEFYADDDDFFNDNTTNTTNTTNETNDSFFDTDVDSLTGETKNSADVDNLYAELNDEKAPDSNDMDSLLPSDDSFEEDEVLQEVDVYIVYGLHEQAEDELKKAIAKNPAKMEYRYKLLENYKAADDAESFVVSAKEFLDAEGENKQKLWEKVVVWGKEIAPENELFSDSSLKNAVGMVAGVAGVAAAGKVATDVFSSDDSTSMDDSVDDLSDLSDFANIGSDDDFATDSDDDFGNIPDLDDNEFDLSDELDLGDDELDLGDDELDLGDDDFGLDALSSDSDASSATSSSGEDITSINLEIDNIVPTENAYSSDASVDPNTEDNIDDNNIDDALSFLDISDDDDDVQDAHIGTKLDLARAYLDMGDVEGARHTLEEVVIEGNDDQKKEAEDLLQQTG